MELSKDKSTIHLLFEQSGTFKSVFKEHGFEAISYDIENDFGETDIQLDLFSEIVKGYNNQPSVFDYISKTDLIIAFYPCTWFSTQNNLFFSRKNYNFRTWTSDEIDDWLINRAYEREAVLRILFMFVAVVKRRNLKMIFENPYHLNYLLDIKEFSTPDLIIHNRRELGDYFIKPTMFYYYNIEPSTFSQFTIINDSKLKTVLGQKGINRSLMHKDFARNFVNKFVLGV